MLSPRATRSYTPTIAPATWLPAAVSAINGFNSVCSAQRVPRRTQRSQIRRLPPIRQRLRQQSAYAPSCCVSCQKPAFIDTRPGHLALWCSNRHHFLHVALSNTPQCSLAECAKPVLIVTDTSTVHEYCCYEHALLARDRGEVCFSQDRPIAPVGTNACVHPGCIRQPVNFSTFCRRTHAYAHKWAAQGLPPPTPPPSPPQSPRLSAADRTDTCPAYPRPVTVTARFFSDVWHMSHAAWNKLQHALHGNGVHRSMRQPGDPLRPPPASQSTTAVTAQCHSHVDTFFQQLTAVARLLAAQGGAPRCALPGCTNLVHIDDANPEHRHNYCSHSHALHAPAARSASAARRAKKYQMPVLTQAMRSCSVCHQRHLDRDCPNLHPPSSTAVSSPPGLRAPGNGPDAATITHRDAQVAQAYDIHSSDEGVRLTLSPHPWARHHHQPACLRQRP